MAGSKDSMYGVHALPPILLVSWCPSISTIYYASHTQVWVTQLFLHYYNTLPQAQPGPSANGQLSFIPNFPVHQVILLLENRASAMFTACVVFGTPKIWDSSLPLFLQAKAPSSSRPVGTARPHPKPSSSSSPTANNPGPAQMFHTNSIVVLNWIVFYSMPRWHSEPQAEGDLSSTIGPWRGELAKSLQGGLAPALAAHLFSHRLKHLRGWWALHTPLKTLVMVIFFSHKWSSTNVSYSESRSILVLVVVLNRIVFKFFSTQTVSPVWIVGLSRIDNELDSESPKMWLN
jgi:hypothetical protein